MNKNKKYKLTAGGNRNYGKVPIHDVEDICQTRMDLGMSCAWCVYKGFKECPKFGTPEAKSVRTIRDEATDGTLSKEAQLKARLDRYNTYFEATFHKP